MVRGNKALSSHRSEEAIQRYTEVLYKLSPGHVCAFLNRSMAYIDEGYYDLAVMDAYRACMAASELCKVRISRATPSYSILQSGSAGRAECFALLSSSHSFTFFDEMGYLLPFSFPDLVEKVTWCLERKGKLIPKSYLEY